MTPEERAAALIAAGFKQTSHKYRLVARLPDGMTGPEALHAYDPGTAEQFRRAHEARCAAHFMRMSTAGSRFKECHEELDPETFEAFKRLGGGVA